MTFIIEKRKISSVIKAVIRETDHHVYGKQNSNLKVNKLLNPLARSI